MNILIACEYSGIVREAFKKKGHYVLSCDLLPTEIPGIHFQGDVRKVLNKSWDMLIGFPPCTHLSSAGARWFKSKQGKQLQAIKFFISLYNSNINKIALENPIGVLSTRFRKPDQILWTYNYGEKIPKRLCLWLKNLPPLFSTNIVEPEWFLYNSKKTKSGKSKYSHFGTMGKGKGKERSKFFYGVANAMAEQWG